MEIFNVEFYKEEDGTKPVGEFIRTLNVKMKAKVVANMHLLEEYGNMSREPLSKELKQTIIGERKRERMSDLQELTEELLQNPDFKAEYDALQSEMDITRSMLAWWVYNDENQQLISNDTSLEIEHIFSRQRQINEKTLTNKNNLESLGNKALLEKVINIRASDYRFEDKKKYYLGFKNDKGKVKDYGFKHCNRIP